MNAPMFVEMAAHQLWQGAVLAGGVWLALRGRRAWSAESRYWVWIAALALIAALPLFSLLPRPQLSVAQPLIEYIEPMLPARDGAASPDALVAAEATAPGGQSLSAAGVLAIALLVLWAGGVCWKLISLLRGALTLRRWRARAEPLPRELLPAAPGNIDVKQSEHVTVPLVAGLRSPCILIPRALAGRLSRAQLRLILLHEMAHVRRRDPWAVLLQRLIEAIYFYNPVVQVVSRQIDRERECACDDRAISAARESSTGYAECLIHVSRQVAYGRAPTLAVGALRHPSQLVTRVERLLDRDDAEDTGLSWRRVVVTSVALVFAAGMLSIVLPRTDAVAEAKSVAAGPADELGRALVLALVDEGMDVQGAARLIDAGANVNTAVDGDGTPLIAAARRGDLPLVDLLLARGADVNLFAAGDGNPLTAAAASGNLEVVAKLVERGADVNAYDAYDESPLINAARGGSLPVVEYLIAHGADVNLAVQASTSDGTVVRTPLSEARRAGHTQIVERLQRSGATR